MARKARSLRTRLIAFRVSCVAGNRRVGMGMNPDRNHVRRAFAAHHRSSQLNGVYISTPFCTFYAGYLAALQFAVKAQKQAERAAKGKGKGNK